MHRGPDSGKTELGKLRQVAGIRINKEVLAIGFGDWLHIAGEPKYGIFWLW